MSEPLTKEQIEDLEGKISQLPTIKKHDDDIKEIVKDLEGLRHGQAALQEAQSENLKQTKALDAKVDGMAKDFIEGLRELGAGIIRKIDEKEMGELKTEIRTLKKKEEKDEAKQWDLVKIVSAALIGGLVSFVGFFLMGVIK